MSLCISGFIWLPWWVFSSYYGGMLHVCLFFMLSVWFSCRWIILCFCVGKLHTTTCTCYVWCHLVVGSLRKGFLILYSCHFIFSMLTCFCLLLFNCCVHSIEWETCWLINVAISPLQSKFCFDWYYWFLLFLSIQANMRTCGRLTLCLYIWLDARAFGLAFNNCSARHTILQLEWVFIDSTARLAYFSCMRFLIWLCQSGK